MNWISFQSSIMRMTLEYISPAKEENMAEAWTIIFLVVVLNLTKSLLFNAFFIVCFYTGKFVFKRFPINILI